MRRTIAAAALLASAAALVACGSPTTGSAVPGPTGETGETTAQPTTDSSPSTCDFQVTPGEPPAGGKDVGLPAGDNPPASVTLVTNHGDITLRMATDTAPCTTLSVGHLAKSGFYDESPCHRITKAVSLSVLQCGDPTGNGTGGPGYTLPDENPKDLKSAGEANYVKYPRGTVAMANTGRPHTGGSQFFLVYADSTLPPTYAVFATIDKAGLAVLDKIAEAGIAGGAAQDGTPAMTVTIEQAKAD